jgi:hypothetical protein
MTGATEWHGRNQTATNSLIAASFDSSSSVMQTYFANQSCDPFTPKSQPCRLLGLRHIPVGLERRTSGGIVVGFMTGATEWHGRNTMKWTLASLVALAAPAIASDCHCLPSDSCWPAPSITSLLFMYMDFTFLKLNMNLQFQPFGHVP